jgi:hypothetical protein
MAYKIKNPKAKEKKYQVEAGRTITEYGQEIFSIHKEEGFSPTEADAMAHFIVNELNKKDDFGRYHRKYLGK